MVAAVKLLMVPQEFLPPVSFWHAMDGLATHCYHEQPATSWQ